MTPAIAVHRSSFHGGGSATFFSRFTDKRSFLPG
jgi:hypothetical protein